MEFFIQLDPMLRGAAIAVELLFATVVLLARGNSHVARALFGASLGVSGYLILSGPGYNGTVFPVLLVFAAACPALVWWAALELFEEADRWRRYVPATVISVIGLAVASFYWTPAGYARDALALSLYAHILLIAWRGNLTDLVEARRRLRRAVLGLGGVVGLTITMVEIVFRDTTTPAFAYPLQSVAVLAISAAFALWLLQVDPAVLPQSGTPDPQQAANLSDADRAILSRLAAAMERGDWQQEGLTIGALATQLDTTEHRLRRVINRGLGHRNFAHFINGYRIRAASLALADPETADRPVLQIAYLVGFSSLGPFNRAFRDQTGLSPTEYRSRSISEHHAPKPQ